MSLVGRVFPDITKKAIDGMDELISNIEGVKAVREDMRDNKVELKPALNSFMKRVLGSIDK